MLSAVVYGIKAAVPPCAVVVTFLAMGTGCGFPSEMPDESFSIKMSNGCC